MKNAMATDYTPSQIEAAAVFMARMQPFMLQGMTFEAAGQAVLERDREIVEFVVGHPECTGQLSDVLARRVYSSCKATAATRQLAQVAAQDRSYNQLRNQ